MSFLPMRLIFVLAYLCVAAAFSGGVWWYGYREAFDQLEQQGQADLALASDRLSGQLQRFREMAVFLADHPTLDQVFETQISTGDALDLLVDARDRSGALDVLVVDATGRELATAQQTVPRLHAGRPYFERSLDGAMGVYHLYSDRWARRAFLFSAPVFSGDGPVIGAVIVAVDVDELEFDWRGGRQTIFYTGDLGVVFVSNRTELLYRSRVWPPQIRGEGGEYPSELLQPFFDFSENDLAGRTYWNVDGGRYLPSKALHLQLDLPVIDMVGDVLVDLGPARQQANLQSAVAAALFLAFGAMLFLATERRRALAEANLRLEARVTQRTNELQKAQGDLVQAGKLSALGQMSAGISHELNQPLMAIRSFAENAETFLQRGQADKAEQNLGRISGLAHRMDRIIKNLRAFARQENEPISDVDIIGVIAVSLEISDAKARQAGVTLNWDAPDTSVMVRGGEVRLQQVVVNLLGNAMDAMVDSPLKQIDISVNSVNGRVVILVRDTGPGIAEPEKIFDPFYSTKEVGVSEGMGLGLSISYGLVQSFGGVIRGRNHDAGGAEFSVELDAVEEQT
ncbi:ATP-binding protein [Aestuariibius sp. HNIBRBA575]|uniref:sensor histidine kinase n=1 Tax=Aestuariibius sp. HNIBRBA575 TaxID=3233343 RepID=UPI0034A48E10